MEAETSLQTELELDSDKAGNALFRKYEIKIEFPNRRYNGGISAVLIESHKGICHMALGIASCESA